MQNLPSHDITLNIRYDAPKEVWDKIPVTYSKMPGWMGFGDDQLPYWFGGDNEDEKHIWASVEPGGLLLCGNIKDDEWVTWVSHFKELATSTLGFEVGDVQDGFV